MNTKKTNIILIIIGVISLVVGIIFKVRLLDIDDAIIKYGYQTVKTYQTISNIAFGFFGIAMITMIVLYVMQRSKETKKVEEETKDKKSNPHHEEQKLTAKLETLYQTEKAYQAELKVAMGNLYQINDCLTDLHDLQENNDYDLLDKITMSMMNAKTQILQNTKSIINRVMIEGSKEEIGKRLESNSNIIYQVRELLNETVNYLDSKSPSTNEDLENMTKALQSLNQTIE